MLDAFLQLQGIPLEDADGSLVSRSRIRKYKKQYEKQVKRHKQYLELANRNSGD